MKIEKHTLEKKRVIEEVRKEFKKFLYSNKNEGTTYQNWWDIVNSVFRGEFTALNTHIKK
jgi:hypothetical protein